MRLALSSLLLVLAWPGHAEKAPNSPQPNVITDVISLAPGLPSVPSAPDRFELDLRCDRRDIKRPAHYGPYGCDNSETAEPSSGRELQVTIM